MRRLALVLLVVVAACMACTSAPLTSSSATLEVSLLESGFDACALLDSATVEAVMGEAVHDATEHLSGAPVEDIRDCVFFERTGQAGLAILSVRQVPTSAAGGEALVAELTEGYPADAAVERGHLASGVSSTAFGYCNAPGFCFSSLAVPIEPYFLIVTIPRRYGDIRDAEALAGAVIQRLTAR